MIIGYNFKMLMCINAILTKNSFSHMEKYFYEHSAYFDLFVYVLIACEENETSFFITTENCGKFNDVHSKV